MHTQRGAILPTSLIMLVIFTMIGISSMQNSSFEKKITRNSQDRELSFQAAEAGLREAEAWLMALVATPSPAAACGAQPCVISLDTDRYLEDQAHDWWIDTDNAAAFSGTSLTGVATAPSYVVEFIRFVPDNLEIPQPTPVGKYYYRVTARGTGSTNNAQTVLETVVARRF